MSLLRTFIAIEIPAEIKKAISLHSSDLRQTLGRSVRWVAPENIHLTLKFLGDTAPSNIAYLSQALQVETGQYAGFEVKVGMLGAFPSPRRARILWVGLDAPPILSRLQHGIEAATAKLGYPPEDKSFAPHLTIGRVRADVSASELQTIRAALENIKVNTIGTFTAKSVHLFKSDLQPGGPMYTCLFTAQLAG
jgi:RNA 2',3'-cyclic 3'-phosphodiesterase